MSYDRWLEAPYADQPEPEDCPDCSDDALSRVLKHRADEWREEGHTEAEIAAMVTEEREELVSRCETCGGERVIDPPTREEIAEVRAEQKFDQLHDEGRM